MVYLPDPDRLQSTYSSAYNSILASRRHSRISSSSAVTILVAPEMDALCAAKMLSLLFKQDDVLHRVIPVSGYPGLEQLRDKLMLIEEVGTFRFLLTPEPHKFLTAAYPNLTQYRVHSRSSFTRLVWVISR
jgi:hypothetical protein